MGDGIRWLVGLEHWMSGVVFARGISPHELAVRMGGDPGAVTEPITDAEAWDLGEAYEADGDGDGVVRVGEQEGLSFAVEYGDTGGAARLAEVSRLGAEAVRYAPMREHPPATVFYARDGVTLCGFGLGEEIWRWGQEPDLLVPDLVRGQVLRPDGAALLAAEDEPYTEVRRRTLGVVEQRFGLSLSPSSLKEARLPAYPVRPAPAL
ncbi:DUF6461 domain-containing protein [Actinacidiphila sp. bgisy144]|uniref:DUF6461 domain-containing protein n=1 Tax=Actinacidiphila sp. bgisy144 TaxID=3413791 RepID=UPI003EBA7242